MAILAVSALVCQHALELAHALTVEHTRCAEHGELLHGTSQIDASGQHAVTAGGPAEEGDHDHCAVDWLSRFQIGIAEASGAAPFEPAIAEVAPPPSIARPAVPLRFAPKTSPPAA